MVAVVLIIVFASLKTFATFYHRRPVVLVGQPPLGLAQAGRDQGGPAGGVRRHLRGVAAASLLVAERLAPKGPSLDAEDEFVKRYQEVIGPYARWLRVAVVTVLVPHRRLPGGRPVEQLDPLPERHPVRRHRSAVPPERGLLRLHPALRAVPRPLGAGRPGGGPVRHRAQPLPERRDPPAGLAAPGPAGGEGPPVGHPRPAGPGQGGRATTWPGSASTTPPTGTCRAPATPTSTPGCRRSNC